jgi:metal-dependent amidase/aminoacylase/carboxypeptidase family protein
LLITKSRTWISCGEPLTPVDDVTTAVPALTLLEDAKSIAGWIVELRRQLHRHPELMYEEVETSRLVRATLDDLGIPYRHSVSEAQPGGPAGAERALGNRQAETGD